MSTQECVAEIATHSIVPVTSQACHDNNTNNGYYETPYSITEVKYEKDTLSLLNSPSPMDRPSRAEMRSIVTSIPQQPLDLASHLSIDCLPHSTFFCLLTLFDVPLVPVVQFHCLENYVAVVDEDGVLGVLCNDRIVCLCPARKTDSMILTLNHRTYTPCSFPQHPRFNFLQASFLANRNIPAVMCFQKCSISADRLSKKLINLPLQQIDMTISSILLKSLQDIPLDLRILPYISECIVEKKVMTVPVVIYVSHKKKSKNDKNKNNDVQDTNHLNNNISSSLIHNNITSSTSGSTGYARGDSGLIFTEQRTSHPQRSSFISGGGISDEVLGKNNASSMTSGRIKTTSSPEFMKRRLSIVNFYEIPRVSSPDAVQSPQQSAPYIHSPDRVKAVYTPFTSPSSPIQRNTTFFARQQATPIPSTQELASRQQDQVVTHTNIENSLLERSGNVILQRKQQQQQQLQQLQTNGLTQHQSGSLSATPAMQAVQHSRRKSRNNPRKTSSKRNSMGGSLKHSRSKSFDGTILSSDYDFSSSSATSTSNNNNSTSKDNSNNDDINIIKDNKSSTTTPSSAFQSTVISEDLNTITKMDDLHNLSGTMEKKPSRLKLHIHVNNHPSDANIVIEPLYYNTLNNGSHNIDAGIPLSHNALTSHAVATNTYTTTNATQDIVTTSLTTTTATRSDSEGEHNKTRNNMNSEYPRIQPNLHTNSQTKLLLDSKNEPHQHSMSKIKIDRVSGTNHTIDLHPKLTTDSLYPPSPVSSSPLLDDEATDQYNASSLVTGVNHNHTNHTTNNTLYTSNASTPTPQPRPLMTVKKYSSMSKIHLPARGGGGAQINMVETTNESNSAIKNIANTNESNSNLHNQEYTMNLDLAPMLTQQISRTNTNETSYSHAATNQTKSIPKLHVNLSNVSNTSLLQTPPTSPIKRPLRPTSGNTLSVPGLRSNDSSTPSGAGSVIGSPRPTTGMPLNRGEFKAFIFNNYKMNIPCTNPSAPVHQMDKNLAVTFHYGYDSLDGQDVTSLFNNIFESKGTHSMFSVVDRNSSGHDNVYLDPKLGEKGKDMNTQQIVEAMRSKLQNATDESGHTFDDEHFDHSMRSSATSHSTLRNEKSMASSKETYIDIVPEIDTQQPLKETENDIDAIPEALVVEEKRNSPRKSARKDEQQHEQEETPLCGCFGGKSKKVADNKGK